MEEMEKAYEEKLTRMSVLASEFLHLADGGNWMDSEAQENTPQRMAKMFIQMTSVEEFDFTMFEAPSQDMVTLAPIPFYTMCEHHTAPFFGSVFISYVPRSYIAGLSKFPRLVKNLTKGFWTQEELTQAIAEDIEYRLGPLGTGVIIQAEHLCMAMRGVQQPGVTTTTSTMKGVYADHTKLARQEFMAIIAKQLA